jgi:hypothetical protein
MSDNLRFKKNLIETNDPQAGILYQVRLGSASTDTTILSSILSSIILAAKHQDGEFGFEFDVYDSQGTNDAYLNYLTRYNATQTVKSLNIATIKDTDTPTPQVILKASQIQFDTFSSGTAFGGGGITDTLYISSQSISTNNLSSGIAYLGNANISSLQVNTVSTGSITVQQLSNVESADITSISSINISSGSAIFGSAQISTLSGFSPITVLDAVLFNSTIYARSTIETNKLKTNEISSGLATLYNINIISSLNVLNCGINYDQSNLSLTGLQNLKISGYTAPRYLGGFTSNPTGSLNEGDIYYNSLTSTMNIYFNSSWNTQQIISSFNTVSSGTAQIGVLTVNEISSLQLSSGISLIGNVTAAGISTNSISTGTFSMNDLTVSSLTAVTSSYTIATKQRIYQQLPYSTTSGYYALDRKKAPLPNPNSAGLKAVTTWTNRSSATDNTWTSIAWSPQLAIFTAVASNGVTNACMSSTDGITWTSRTTNANAHESVCWSPELAIFCAVASTGTNNRVMTSTNGTSWTTQSTASVTACTWKSVCWSSELRLFVAVADSGTNRVMTSPNGVTWTQRTPAADNAWGSVCWSPELVLFVAVSSDGTDRVMTSSDGINWTAQISSHISRCVCWSSELGLFVAPGFSTSGDKVAISSNGITWTLQNAASNLNWANISWCSELGLFVAVANNATSASLMTSPDAITWNSQTVPTQTWYGITWSPELGLVCIVGQSGTGNRVLSSSLLGRPPTSYNVFDNTFNRIDQSGIWYYSQVSSANVLTSSLTANTISTGNLLTTGLITSAGISTITLSSGTTILGNTTIQLLTATGVSTTTLSSGTAILGTTATQLLTATGVSTTTLSSGTTILGNTTTQLLIAAAVSTTTLSSGTAIFGEATINGGLSTLTLSSGTAILGTTTIQRLTAAGVSTTTVSSGTTILGTTTILLLTAAGVSTTTLSSGTAILGTTTTQLLTAAGISTTSLSSGTTILGATLARGGLSTLTLSSGTTILGATTTQLLTAAGVSTTTVSSGTAILGTTTTQLLTAAGVSTTTLSSGTTILGTTTTQLLTASAVSTTTLSSGTTILGATLARGGLSTLTLSSGTSLLGATTTASISTLTISSGSITTGLLSLAGVSTTTLSSGTTILGTTTTQLLTAAGVSTTTLSSGTAILGFTTARGGLSTLTLSSGTTILGATTAASISTLSISSGSITTGVFTANSISTLQLSTGAASIGLLNVSTLAGFSPINIRDAMITNSTIITSTLVTNLVNTSSIGSSTVPQLNTMTLIANDDNSGKLYFGSTPRTFISTFNQLSLLTTSSINIGFGILSTVSIISTVNMNGNAIIGSSNAPTVRLELFNSSNGTAATGNTTIWNESLGFTGNGRAWTIGIETSTALNYSFGFFNYSNTAGGPISGTRFLRAYLLGSNAGKNQQMNFTGQHRCIVKDESISTLQSKIGLIVCSDNNTYIDMSSGSTIRGKGAISIDEALPVVSLARKDYDKSCFGVISLTEDPSNRIYEAGAFVTPYVKELGDNRAFINALGEGSIWVTNKNGILQAGDYIASSHIPGYGQKQDDDCLHNYTVAKATMDCDFTAPLQSTYEILRSSYEFSTATSTFISSINVLDQYGNLIWIPAVDSNGIPIMESAYDIRYVDSNGTIITEDQYRTYTSTLSTAYIAAFIGCTYHCG